jgi:hypothetical protein
VSPLYLNDISILFANVQAHVSLQRTLQGLNPLKTGGFLFGQEMLHREHSPPRIVIVPTGATYAKTRRMPQGGTATGRFSDLDPKVFLARLQTFEAHIWGQDTLTPSNPMTVADLVSGFNDCVELERSFLDGMRIYCGNVFNLHVERSEFRQPTDDNRLGRLYVLTFAIETQVSTLPATVLPYSSTPIPGSSVQVSLTVSTEWSDGSSTAVGSILIPHS